MENAKIFIEQGKALDAVASRDIRVLVVGNPANTNCLHRDALGAVAAEEELHGHAAPRSQPRAVAARARRPASRSARSKSSASGATTRRRCTPTTVSRPSAANRSRRLINDENWNRNVFLPTVGKRGAAIIEARGLSSAASAANAAIDHVRDWTQGTNGRWVTMGVPSDGSYGIPQDVMYGVPVTTADGEYTRVTGSSDRRLLAREDGRHVEGARGRARRRRRARAGDVQPVPPHCR